MLIKSKYNFRPTLLNDPFDNILLGLKNIFYLNLNINSSLNIFFNQKCPGFFHLGQILFI